MTVWVTSDLHLGHRRAVEFSPPGNTFLSVESRDNWIEVKWRCVVSKRDVVYLLGDIAFNRAGWKRLAALPGKKKLILGNHDRPAGADGVVTSIHAYHEFKTGREGVPPMLCSHIPVHESCLGSRYSLNVHGHTHARTVGSWRYVNVGIDQGPFLMPLEALQEHAWLLWQENAL